jgi:hypothetical protein
MFENAMRRYRGLSDEARESGGTLLDVEYDATSGQTFDIFGTACFCSSWRISTMSRRTWPLAKTGLGSNGGTCQTRA